jgi:hypothetical protein
MKRKQHPVKKQNQLGSAAWLKEFHRNLHAAMQLPDNDLFAQFKITPEERAAAKKYFEGITDATETSRQKES